MYKQKYYIAHLIARYIAEELSSKEQADLDQWRHESAQNESLFQRVISSQNIQLFLEEYTQVDINQAWSKFENKRKELQHKKRFKRVLSYAAVALLPLCVGLLTLIYLPSSSSQADTFLAHDINPGVVKATLELSSGYVRKLTDQDTLQLDKNIPALAEATLPQTAKELPMNKIQTPRGGEYQLVLSDGTKVYLNALSTLSFPDEFTTDERRVSLVGEAYFEVSKSARPFIVSTDYANIEVLGTKFNVSAYADEPYQAALVEGSIAIATEAEKQLLKPSQGATIFEKGAPMLIEEVDASSISAWYAGKIIFKDQTLEYMMKRLARWYDFEVVFQREVLKQLQFSCAVNKYENISDFIHLLESTQKIKAEINNQIIYLK